VRGQHRLGVLLLVLDDHPEREPVLDQPAPLERHGVEQVQHLGAHGADVRPGLGRPEQGQARPVDAGVLERVVQLVDVLPYRGAAADVTHEPELLLVPDVGQVPHQRRHERRVLADEIVVVDRAREHGRAFAAALQFARHARA
jgi:hypothetical protein